jgi:hypothetical protein
MGRRPALLKRGSVVRGREKRQRGGVYVCASVWRWEKEGRGGPGIVVISRGWPAVAPGHRARAAPLSSNRGGRRGMGDVV